MSDEKAPVDEKTEEKAPADEAPAEKAEKTTPASVDPKESVEVVEEDIPKETLEGIVEQLALRVKALEDQVQRLRKVVGVKAKV